MTETDVDAGAHDLPSLAAVGNVRAGAGRNPARLVTRTGWDRVFLMSTFGDTLVPSRWTAWVVVEMTRQYLSGELSVLLARLEAVATGRAATVAAARLRREAETWPVPALGCVVLRALALDDGLCWESLTRGDEAAFARQARVGADLREFGVCAGLLADP